MTDAPATRRTTVGTVADSVLAFTAGDDVRLDRGLIEVDCLGTAAHVTMLAGMPVTPPVLREDEVAAIRKELAEVVRQARTGAFAITAEDQDVHLAVERHLTQALGETGQRVHTARSRNDQVAVDLRLLARIELAGAAREAARLASVLLDVAERHRDVPMAGRTHMQPAMPSSVGLWASAWAEELGDGILLLGQAFDLADRCPLGSAASYGVPLPIDRQLVSDLLGFREPCHNVLYAANGRGRLESIILHALAQVMLTLSRLAQDLILFSMPEFGYFHWPRGFGTGSSIMPQKNNPDVLELVRARAARVMSHAAFAQELVRAAPSGYNRDVQEAKGPFLDGLATTRATLRILDPLVAGTEIDEARLAAGFEAGVFATDRALELVGEGVPFRAAYDRVKAELADLAARDPREAVARKTHLGAPAGLDFGLMRGRIGEAAAFADTFEPRWARIRESLLPGAFPET